jgi:asparagine synthase (glutamine-hydrolysing)
VPLLDHRLVEYVWGLPLEFKLRNGDSKYLIRKLLASLVPRELWARPKMGFRVPIGELLRGPLRNWADDLLALPRLHQEGFLRASEISRIWSAHRSGRADASYMLWNTLMFQAWLESYVRGR